MESLWSSFIDELYYANYWGNIKKIAPIFIGIIASKFEIWNRLERIAPDISIYLLTGYILYFLYLLVKKSRGNSKEVIDNGVIKLTTNNDYAQKATSLILGFVLIVLTTYFLFYSNYFNKINVALFLVIAVLMFVMGFYQNRSLKIFLENDKIVYQLNQTDKSFYLSDLISVEFTNNDILFLNKDENKHELSFLEMTNKDIEIAINFLKMKLNSDIKVQFLR